MCEPIKFHLLLLFGCGGFMIVYYRLGEIMHIRDISNSNTLKNYCE